MNFFKLCERSTFMTAVLLNNNKCVNYLPGFIYKRQSHHQHQPAYYHQPGTQPLLYHNLGQQLLQTAAKYPDRAAIISLQEQAEISYAQLQRQAAILAHHLLALGLKRGDHVAIWATNTIHWEQSCFAAVLAGFPLVCLNPAWQPAELRFALRKAKVKALITMDESGRIDFLKTLQPLWQSRQRELPDLQLLLLQSNKSFKTLPEALNFEHLLQTPVSETDLAQLYADLPTIGAETPFALMFTSGTTGAPKAAMLSHFNYVNLARAFGPTLLLDKGHKRACVTVPFFHAFGMTAMLSGLHYGATLVLANATYDVKAALKAIEKERCNIFLGTPTMFVDLALQQERLQCNLESLETGFTGGAAMAPEVNMRVRKELGLRHMRVGYGQSESTSGIYVTTDEQPVKEQVQTIGLPFAHLEVKVVNSEGETLNLGERGELCVRGYCRMLGYYEDEQKTAEVITPDGWLKTGDEAILEANGLARIVGRKKDMVIRGGENIYPKEIEDFLQTHADILEAHVIGVPDARLGEELCAYLRIRPGVTPLTQQQVKEFCEGNLAYFKIPLYVRILENFPKTESGKIQKFKLRELFVNETRVKENERQTAS